MSPTSDTGTKIAVRCENCKKILAFKLGTASGYLQLKCPAYKTEVRVDLSLRRGRIYNRRTNIPITISFEFIDSEKAHRLWRVKSGTGREGSRTSRMSSIACARFFFCPRRSSIREIGESSYNYIKRRDRYARK